MVSSRITSYNVCYTKLLRARQQGAGDPSDAGAVDLEVAFKRPLDEIGFLAVVDVRVVVVEDQLPVDVARVVLALVLLV